MSQEQYTILKNDCLSLLALKFNVTQEQLLSLNSEMIKNPDLIIEGETLNIPKKSAGEDKRWPLPDVPTCQSKKADTCSKPQPMVDILYVPADPISGKRNWYSVSAEAKEKILEEKAKMAAAIVSEDAETTRKNLRLAGLLSKFELKQHEQFFDSKQDLERYKALALAKLTLESNAFVCDGKNPNETLLSFAEVLDYDLATQYKLKLHRRSYNSYNLPKSESQSYYEEGVNLSLRADLLRATNDAINELEEQAKRDAKGKVSSDGTRFVYLEKLEFYSTEQQRNVLDALKSLKGNARSKRKKESELMFLSVASGKSYFSNWKESMQESWLELKDKPKLAIVRRNDKYYYDAESIHVLNLNGYAIKEQCLTTKQLFGESGATLGPRALAGINWRQGEDGKAKPLDINNQKLIEALYRELAGPQLDIDNSRSARSKVSAKTQGDLESLVNQVDYNWAYFPTLALISLVDETISKHKQALTQLLETGKTPIDSLFNQLLWIKKVANARLDSLKRIATNNAEKGLGGLQFSFASDDKKLANSMKLLWLENKFEPKRVNNPGFRNKAGYNDLQAVECAFLSDGEVFYMRGPAWFIPGDDRRLINQANTHLVNITSKSQLVNPLTKGAKELEPVTVSDALKQLFSNDNDQLKMDLLPIKIEAKHDSTFWREGYHYQEGVGPDGKTGAYSVDAGVQFLRFTSQAEAQLNTPLDSYSSLIKKTKQIGASGGMSASLIALQGQLSVKFCLPMQENSKGAAQEVKPYHLTIDYLDKHGKTHTYSAGFLYAVVEGSVYGLAGATCSLSAGVTIGPTEIGEGFGIRGNTIDLFSPNIVDMRATKGSNLSTVENAKVAAEAAVKGDVFAGVEAGGVLTAEAFWFPPIAKQAELVQSVQPDPKPQALQNKSQQPESAPSQTKQDDASVTYDKEGKLKLGAISGKAAVSAGAGASAEFGVKMQGGVFIFTAQAKLVFGVGCGGSVDLELNGNSLNDFVDCLLGVLKQSEFRRISAFGEADENGINKDFELLNDVLTIATAFGLTFAKAMLLPFDVWQDYKKQSLSKEYAPFLASNINNDDPKLTIKMRTWIVALPPETLANLLKALSVTQLGVREGSKGERIRAEQDNLNQAKAIVQIMKWIADDKNKTNLINQRQWKESLIAMADLPKDTKDYVVEWEGFKDSWLRLARYVSDTNDLYLADEFSEYSVFLSKNMVLTQYDDVVPVGLGVTIKKYHAYCKANVINSHEGVGTNAKIIKETGLADNHWQLVETQEEIINWSLNDVKF
ncbi:hypothetical protein BIY22_03780 [Vibrio panuliri]|uniref:LysM domain-containing protein n=1 Tax=Vibrio panuliri TaxID=1381081 RepID=A0A1Q9HII1_9VIBR|nr:LysM peptidoglycan-binding domain-containing protein [Vibrio panuliri]OLQ90134.1 hypothetical protein BIY22_03780 [Vibrio panuliri]